MTTLAPGRATCRDCGRPFRFNDAFYVDRGLNPPTRCASCRHQRREHRLSGRVVRVDASGRFAFVLGINGVEYYVNVTDFGAEPVALLAGLELEFTPRDTPSGFSYQRASRARVVGFSSAGEQ